MLLSKKRRLSVSPERSQQPQDTPEPKKRKIINVVSNEASSSNTAGPSQPRVAPSPEPIPSDSSATLDGDSPPSQDKGKGKAVERDPVMVELEQLRREVAQKNELLKKNEKTTTAILQTLSCHVCLDTMCLPYALAPCGHMACQTCLVNWFTSSHNDKDNDAENPHIDWYSDEASDDEADGPNPEAGSGGNGAHANAPNVDGSGGLPPAVAALANMPVAAHPPFPDATNRRKSCPHCRCIIRQRPIQIYPVKDLLAILAPRPELEAQAIPKKDSRSDGKDPWKGIFRPGPIYHDDDDSDGDAPWPGFGADFFGPHGPMLVPPAHPAPPPPPPPPPLLPQPPPPLLPQPPPPPPFVDLEDGVRRCGVCMHEVWGGVCTNAGCNVVYSDQSEGSDDGVELAGDAWYDYDGSDEDVVVPIQPNYPEAVDGDVEDGYESSFIDDDDGGDDRGGLLHRLRRSIWPGRGGTTSDPEEVVDEDDFLPGPSRRLSGRRQETIVISSDDDDDGVDDYMPRVAGRGRPRQIIDVDEEDEEEEEEQEVEGDVRSADESHSSVHFLASDFVSEHQFTEPSGVPYLEEDEEYYGNEEVPYVWEADGEGDSDGLEEEDHDNGYHLQDEEEEEDNEEDYES